MLNFWMILSDSTPLNSTHLACCAGGAEWRVGRPATLHGKGREGAEGPAHVDAAHSHAHTQTTHSHAVRAAITMSTISIILIHALSATNIPYSMTKINTIQTCMFWAKSVNHNTHGIRIRTVKYLVVV